MNETPDITVIQRADMPFRVVQGDGAVGLSLARLYQRPDRALTFQLARIEPGGISRRHAHAWEQVNLVISGHGTIDAAGQQIVIAPGDCVIFPGDVSHAISCTGDEPLLLVGVLGPGAA
jgi:quercetin dioxygenase-like cupin family protein